MPSGRVDQTLYVGPFKSVEAINVTTLYKPGELGSQIQLGTKGYQLVQVDSGATASTAAGVPLCGHTAFWKNRNNYIVTNDKAQAETVAGDARNSIAGVFNSLTSGAAATASITPGNFGVIQQRGTHVGVLTNGTAAAAGDTLVPVATATSGTAAAVRVAAGTAPTCVVIGIATAATSAVTTNYTPCRLGGTDLVDQG